jgi:hypothetical protein
VIHSVFGVTVPGLIVPVLLWLAAMNAGAGGRAGPAGWPGSLDGIKWP